MHKKKIVLFMFIVALTGCASITPFKSLPESEDEFLLEKTKLVEKYPEISVYENKKWPDELHIARANFSDPLDREPQVHGYYDTHVDWFAVNDNLRKKPAP